MHDKWWPWDRDPTLAEFRAGDCKAWAQQFQADFGGELIYVKPEFVVGEAGDAANIGTVVTRDGEVIVDGTNSRFKEHWAVHVGDRIYDRITGPNGMPIDQYKGLFEYADDLTFAPP